VSSEVATAVSTVVSDKLGQYLEHHPKEARNIINKAVVASRAREADVAVDALASAHCSKGQAAREAVHPDNARHLL
jgi:DNA gyrase/topoisomerase IV subunit B